MRSRDVVSGETTRADGRFDTVRDPLRPVDELDAGESRSEYADLDSTALDPDPIDEPDVDEGDLEATVVRATRPAPSEGDSGAGAGADNADLAETVLRTTTVDSPNPGLAPLDSRAPIAPRTDLDIVSDWGAAGGDSAGDVDAAAVAHRTARIRLGTTVLELTVPAIIGRRPTAPRVAHGAAPMLVPVASPKLEISGAHLSLRQSGRVVVATDLHSRNGTRVTIPGAAPRLLCGGDSVVVSTGSILDLGEDVRIEVLPPRVNGDTTADGAGS